MGTIFNNRTLNPHEIMHLPSPIILGIDRPDIDNTITDAGYQKISLNLPLARSLKGLSDSSIRSVVNEKVYDILPQTSPIFLTDFEMLFDPRYNLDVIKLFTYISRQNKLLVKWCGTIYDNMLIYSEPGYTDYKTYKINDYDITVIN